jgi:hypothetical protein
LKELEIRIVLIKTMPMKEFNKDESLLIIGGYFPSSED